MHYSRLAILNNVRLATKYYNRTKYNINSIHSFFPSLSLPNVLCDPTDHIWRKGTPFEAMTGWTAFSDGLLA